MMTVYTKIVIAGNENTLARDTIIEKTMNQFNTISSFDMTFDNPLTREDGDFTIDDNILIYADITSPATTLLFDGLIDDIDYTGKETKEMLTISGREYGSIMQDIIANSRIFTDTEVSEIVKELMAQNISSITTNNVNTTTTTVDKITFANLSVYDAISQLAEIAGYYFYVDLDRDLHFIAKTSISSGITLDNSNVSAAKFRESDQDKYTRVTVVGDRQFTIAQAIQTTGTDNTGSVYNLDAKPTGVGVTLSGATNTILQPGGILNMQDPSADNVKFLVDYDAKQVVLTSGTTAGDNIQAAGSVVIFDYQRSTPIISIKSVAALYPKHKVITDLKIKSLEEASTKATAFLNEHKDNTIEANIDIKGLLNLTPGNSVVVNLPHSKQSNQIFDIHKILYQFNTINNQGEDVINLQLNR